MRNRGPIALAVAPSASPRRRRARPYTVFACGSYDNRSWTASRTPASGRREVGRHTTVATPSSRRTGPARLPAPPRSPPDRYDDRDFTLPASSPTAMESRPAAPPAVRSTISADTVFACAATTTTDAHPERRRLLDAIRANASCRRARSRGRASRRSRATPHRDLAADRGRLLQGSVHTPHAPRAAASRTALGPGRAQTTRPHPPPSIEARACSPAGAARLRRVTLDATDNASSAVEIMPSGRGAVVAPRLRGRPGRARDRATALPPAQGVPTSGRASPTACRRQRTSRSGSSTPRNVTEPARTMSTSRRVDRARSTAATTEDVSLRPASRRHQNHKTVTTPRPTITGAADSSGGRSPGAQLRLLTRDRRSGAASSSATPHHESSGVYRVGCARASRLVRSRCLARARPQPAGSAYVTMNTRPRRPAGVARTVGVGQSCGERHRRGRAPRAAPRSPGALAAGATRRSTDGRATAGALHDPYRFGRAPRRPHVHLLGSRCAVTRASLRARTQKRVRVRVL